MNSSNPNEFIKRYVRFPGLTGGNTENSKSWLGSNLVFGKFSERPMFGELADIVHSAPSIMALFGVNDDCEVKGLSRDLLTYGAENDIKNRDNLLKDINSTCRKHLGTRVIGLLTITYETVEEEEILMIEVSSSDEPFFDEEDVFYLRNGPETITLVGQNLANYILKRFGRSEPSSLDVIPQQTMGLDERIGILKRIIKNLMIEYYFGGKVGKSFNPKINTIVYKLAKVINNFDNSTL